MRLPLMRPRSRVWIGLSRLPSVRVGGNGDLAICCLHRNDMKSCHCRPPVSDLVERTAGDWLGVTLDGLMNHLTADPRGLGCFYVLRGFPPPPPSTHSHSPGHWLIFDAWACGLMGVPLTQ